MHTLAMSSTEHNLWTIANILGLVVVVAVAALLSLLIYLVKVIDRRVVQVRDTLKAAAANTSASRYGSGRRTNELCASASRSAGRAPARPVSGSHRGWENDAA